MRKPAIETQSQETRRSYAVARQTRVSDAGESTAHVVSQRQRYQRRVFAARRH